MKTSELMKAMADAGAPFEAILIAVQALDAKDAEIAERDREQAEKRAKDAERKRFERANGKPSRRRPRNVRGHSRECPMDPPIEDHTPPVSSNEETKRARKPKAGTVAKPEGVSEQVWRDFTKQRKTPVTETALAGIEREARKAGWTLEAALAKCAARGWQGFEAGWVDAAKPPGSSPANDLVSSILGRETA